MSGGKMFSEKILHDTEFKCLKEELHGIYRQRLSTQIQHSSKSAKTCIKIYLK